MNNILWIWLWLCELEIAKDCHDSCFYLNLKKNQKRRDIAKRLIEIQTLDNFLELPV